MDQSKIKILKARAAIQINQNKIQILRKVVAKKVIKHLKNQKSNQKAVARKMKRVEKKNRKNRKKDQIKIVLNQNLKIIILKIIVMFHSRIFLNKMRNKVLHLLYQMMTFHIAKDISTTMY